MKIIEGFYKHTAQANILSKLGQGDIDKLINVVELNFKNCIKAISEEKKMKISEDTINRMAVYWTNLVTRDLKED